MNTLGVSGFFEDLTCTLDLEEVIKFSPLASLSQYLFGHNDEIAL